ncbi:hypothetical protein ACHWQZ_G015793 [Mnemiopsis leidyi]
MIGPKATYTETPVVCPVDCCKTTMLRCNLKVHLKRCKHARVLAPQTAIAANETKTATFAQDTGLSSLRGCSEQNNITTHINEAHPDEQINTERAVELTEQNPAAVFSASASTLADSTDIGRVPTTFTMSLPRTNPTTNPAINPNSNPNHSPNPSHSPNNNPNTNSNPNPNPDLNQFLFGVQYHYTHVAL